MLLKTRRSIAAAALAAVLHVQHAASGPVTCAAGSHTPPTLWELTPTVVTNSGELIAALLAQNTNAAAAIITLTTTAAYNLTAGYAPLGDLCLQTDELSKRII